MTLSKKQLIDKMVDLLMEKQFPERSIEFRGFCDGKQVVLQKITYEAGGFDIKSRWVNKDFCDHNKHKSCEKYYYGDAQIETESGYRCSLCKHHHQHATKKDKKDS